MYKISVPISIESISDAHIEEDLQKYTDYFRKGEVERIFIAIMAMAYEERAKEYLESEKLKYVVEYFKAEKFEVGIWFNGFGHGGALMHDTDPNAKKGTYQKLTGVMGDTVEHGYCPLDKDFENSYLEHIKRIAKLSPDIIMIDDDFRLNMRGNYFACFCPEHLKRYYELVGEEIPRDKIEQFIFCGGRNKYRDAYLELARKTLVDLASNIRKAIDEVDPHIRAGVCLVPCVWDFEGTDAIELAKVFAGETKPFTRNFGAPYHDKYCVIDAIEVERMQFNWIKQSGEDIEVFSEGDVYPRPRYNVPSKSLELFDIAILCDGQGDGILKYMFPYEMNVSYETGYIDRHLSGMETKKQIKALFDGKESCGVRVYGAMHKIRDFVMPDTLEYRIVDKLQVIYKTYTSAILSRNGIPTCYTDSEYPVMVCGESARHISLYELSHGAILDSAAARILTERGVDVGLCDVQLYYGARGELYLEANEVIADVSGCRLAKLKCNENAVVHSRILSDNLPGMYTYENNDGVRFFVIACDIQFSSENSNYFVNYYRQKAVADCIQWVAGKRLPALCLKEPNLYVMTAKGDNKMSVLMMNVFMDDIEKVTFTLDKEYSAVRFVNCSGRLDKDKIYIDFIGAYGFAAFEVS